MAFIPAADTVRVFWEHEYLGKPGVGWVMHFEHSAGTNDAAEMNALAAALVADWNTHFKPLMVAGCRLVALRLRDMSVQDGLEVTYSTGLPIVGTRAGAAMPSNTALTLKQETGLAGRSRRGRTYWFAMAEGDVVDNFFNGTYVTSVRTALNNITLVPTAGALVWQLVVASFITGGQPRNTALLTPVSSFVATDARVDTQRRRLPR